MYFVDKFRFWLKSGNKIENFTWRPTCVSARPIQWVENLQDTFITVITFVTMVARGQCRHPDKSDVIWLHSQMSKSNSVAHAWIAYFVNVWDLCICHCLFTLNMLTSVQYFFISLYEGLEGFSVDMRWIASAWFHQHHLRQDITLSETLLVGERIASSLNIYIHTHILLLWSNSILTFLHLHKQRSFDRIFDQNWCLLECRRSILIYMLNSHLLQYSIFLWLYLGFDFHLGSWFETSPSYSNRLWVPPDLQSDLWIRETLAEVKWHVIVWYFQKGYFYVTTSMYLVLQKVTKHNHNISELTFSLRLNCNHSWRWRRYIPPKRW